MTVSASKARHRVFQPLKRVEQGEEVLLVYEKNGRKPTSTRVAKKGTDS